MNDYFDRLENELRAAALRQEAPAPRASSPRRVARTSRPLLALVVALIVAVPAAAAVVVFRPEREPDGLVRTAPKDQIAAGTDPQFGRWTAFVSDSDSGPCFGVRLIDPPGVQPGGVMEGCGGGDSAARIGGGDGPPRTALYGFAPRAATRVRIEARGVPGREFPTHPTNDQRGAFFFASLPQNPGRLRALRVVALRSDGSAIATIPSP